MTRASVIVPAHNEEAVIGRLLAGMLADAAGELDIVVVANGCTDDTATVARAAGPGVRVVEIAEASKIAALNAGDDATTVFPRVYVDADVEVSGATVLALAELLERGPALVASPRVQLDLEDVSRAVRWYYAVWELSAFRQAGHIGSGVFALSAEGRARFGRFPDLIADDRFVQGRFAPNERATSDYGSFVVRPPRTIRALVGRGGRIAAGNRQLRDAGLAGFAPSAGSSLSQLASRIAPKPGLWLPFAVYCVVQLRTRRLAARKLAAQSVPVWDRDETSRV